MFNFSSKSIKWTMQWIQNIIYYIYKETTDVRVYSRIAVQTCQGQTISHLKTTVVLFIGTRLATDNWYGSSLLRTYVCLIVITILRLTYSVQLQVPLSSFILWFIEWVLLSKSMHHMAVYVCKSAFTIQEGCGFHDSTAQPNTVHCYSLTFCSRY